MIEDELAHMLVRGTRGGVRKNSRSRLNKKRTGAKTATRKSTKGKAKSGYIAHVKKFWAKNPHLSWKEAMGAARHSYIPKGGAMAGKRKSCKKRAGAMAGASIREKAANVNRKLRDKKAISKTLRALSAIPTPISGYATDAALVAEALGYGRRR